MDIMTYSHNLCGSRKSKTETQDRSDQSDRREMGSLDHGHLRIAKFLLSIQDRKSTRLNSSHEWSSYAVFCLKKKKTRARDWRLSNGGTRSSPSPQWVCNPV